MDQKNDVAGRGDLAGNALRMARDGAVGPILDPAELVHIAAFEVGLEEIELERLAEAAAVIRDAVRDAVDGDPRATLGVAFGVAGQQDVLPVEGQREDLFIRSQAEVEDQFQRPGGE